LTLCYQDIVDTFSGYMPWKKTDLISQRYELVRQMQAGEVSVVELCRQFGITRQAAYKWRHRYRRSGLSGLKDRLRRPLRCKHKLCTQWIQRIRRARLRHPTWGARNLRWKLVRRFGAAGAPSTATISRYLRAMGLARGRRRQRRGPVLLRKALHVPSRCHEVWTVDFKGWFRTGDGQRVEPLTVRDLHSRFVLGAVLLVRNDIERTRRAFGRLFRRYGVPERIRCDNGTPFGGGGPTGLTRLSAWWVKLGIKVDFITPGRPCENGAHEQFHRVYKAEVARRPAATLRVQQQRTDRWVMHYNRHRPHQGLGMKTPAEVFRSNRRRLKAQRPWSYPSGWVRKWVKGNGEITNNGSRRYVGEAFVRDYVGLKPMRRGVWEVYFGPLLIGQLHEEENGSIRMAKYARAR
jgi:putative transposase